MKCNQIHFFVICWKGKLAIHYNVYPFSYQRSWCNFSFWRCLKYASFPFRDPILNFPFLDFRLAFGALLIYHKKVAAFLRVSTWFVNVLTYNSIHVLIIYEKQPSCYSIIIFQRMLFQVKFLPLFHSIACYQCCRIISSSCHSATDTCKSSLNTFCLWRRNQWKDSGINNQQL